MASAATARRMTALVRRWEASVESKAEFVRRHDVSLASFEYWKRRLRRAASAGEAVRFAAVRLVSDASEADGRDAVRIVVELATGERLIVPPGVSADHVRAIVAALRSVC